MRVRGRGRAEGNADTMRNNTLTGKQKIFNKSRIANQGREANGAVNYSQSNKQTNRIPTGGFFLPTHILRR